MDITILAGVQKGHISGQKMVIFWEKIVIEFQGKVHMNENFLIYILDLYSYIVANVCTFPF